MEEYGAIFQIIVFALLVIVPIIQQITKNNKKKRANAEQPKEFEVISWDADDYDLPRNESPEGEYRWGSDGNFARQSPIAQPVVSRPVPVNAADKPHAVSQETMEEADDELMSDFDLTKAVIYSEILKPKFDE